MAQEHFPQAYLPEMQALRQCQTENRRYGLEISEEALRELVALHHEALRQSGRVEFGVGILPKLMAAFRSSPYVDRESFPEILGQLQDSFYAFKNESRDLFSDDEIIEWMASVFNGCAHGSTEILDVISLDQLCRWARDPDAAGDLEELV